MPNRSNRIAITAQLLGMFAVAVIFSFGVLSTHPQVYYLASSADGLALIDLVNDLLSGISFSAWNLPRAPSFFPDQLIALIALLISKHTPTIILIISTIHYCLLCLIFWLILSADSKIHDVNLFGVSLVLTGFLIAILTLLPDSVETIFYQLFTSGTHLGSALLSLFLIFFLRTKNKQRQFFSANTLILMLAILGSVSNSMFTLLLLIWLGKEILRFGIPKAIVHTCNVQNLLLVLGLAIGMLINLTLPRQPLKESFLTTPLWSGRASQFADHLISTPSALALFILLITCAIICPFWEKQKPFILKNYKENLKILLANDFALPSLSLIIITPLLYQEWNSLRYLMFPALFLLLCICKKWFIYLNGDSCKNFPFLKRLTYIFIATLVCLFFFSKQEPNANQLVIDDGLRCIQNADKEINLEDGVASYWQARPIRFASNFDYFLAQVKPDFPQMGFFYWGNNGMQFVYSDKQQTRLRNYNYILATQEEIEQDKWGLVLSQANRTFSCDKTTVFYYTDPTLVWNFLFTKNQVFMPYLLPGLWAKQTEFLERSPQIFLATDLPTEVGNRQVNRIYTKNQSGYLVYGPYINLNAGNYRLNIGGSIPNGILEITAQNGDILLLKQAIAPLANASTGTRLLKSIDFSLKSPQTRIEFRILISDSEDGYFDFFSLELISKPEK